MNARQAAEYRDELAPVDKRARNSPFAGRKKLEKSTELPPRRRLERDHTYKVNALWQQHLENVRLRNELQYTNEKLRRLEAKTSRCIYCGTPTGKRRVCFAHTDLPRLDPGFAALMERGPANHTRSKRQIKVAA